MDFKVLASRLGVDEEDFLELVELFVTTSLSDIEKIKQGLEAGSSEDAAGAAHSIKGAAGNLGFDDLFEMAKSMEMQARQGNLENFGELVKSLASKVKALDVSSKN